MVERARESKEGGIFVVDLEKRREKWRRIIGVAIGLDKKKKRGRGILVSLVKNKRTKEKKINENIIRE